MSEPESGGGRSLDALRRTIHDLQGLFASRLELASVELAEEKYRLAQLLFLAKSVAVFGQLALVFGTLTVVVLTWDTPARNWVLAAFTLVYAGATVWLYRRLRHRLKNDAMPFSGTIDEFRKDRAWFSNKT
jgi:uncharacterized membrane protein YqjE